VASPAVSSSISVRARDRACVDDETHAEVAQAESDVRVLGVEPGEQPGRSAPWQNSLTTDCKPSVLGGKLPDERLHLLIEELSVC
jgi:hypothetical protein